MPAQSELTLALVGDVRVDRADPMTAFQHVRDILRAADFTFGNLEGAIADGGTPWVKAGGKWKSGSGQMAAIKDAGFDALCVTNNHIMDFGHSALVETIENLGKIGVLAAGGGRNSAEAYAPAIVEKQGCKVALLGYAAVYVPGWEAGPDTAGIAVLRGATSYEPPVRFLEGPGRPPIIHSWILKDDMERLRQDIAAARKRADLVVCSFHWGYSGDPDKLTEYQPDLGRHAVDCGADLVFGHHPHELQGVEIHNGKPILYSLGNFIFDSRKGTAGLEKAIARCRIVDRKITAIDFLPVLDEGNSPRVLDLVAGRQVLELIRQRTLRFGTRLVEKDNALRVELPG